jgi:hypothetical protein
LGGRHIAWELSLENKLIMKQPESEKMLIAMKPNAPHPISQFDRATVNRPLMRARLGARTGAELRAHHDCFSSRRLPYDANPQTRKGPPEI